MYIHIKATPNSKKELVTEVDDAHLEIHVKEPAKHNLANQRIMQILREKFPNAKDIKIVSGHHSPSKLFSVNVEPE